MSDRNFSRRRSGGMRFRPSGGLGAKPDRGALEARAEILAQKEPEPLFDQNRHEQEIANSENIAAGMPAQPARSEPQQAAPLEPQSQSPSESQSQPQAENQPQSQIQPRSGAAREPRQQREQRSREARPRRDNRQRSDSPQREPRRELPQREPREPQLTQREPREPQQPRESSQALQPVESRELPQREPREPQQPRESSLAQQPAESRESSQREPREAQQATESRELPQREPREPQQSRDSSQREPREGQQQRQPREQQPRQQREQRQPREQQPRQQRDQQPREPRDQQQREPRDQQPSRDQQQPRDQQPPREARDQRGYREPREQMEDHDHQEFHDTEPNEAHKGDSHEHNQELTEASQEEKYEPVVLEETAPQGIMESLKHVANKVIKKVKRIIKPPVVTQKEVVINSESLETRVAVLESGRLEEFTIERTTEERLVGSIFKGKVRNLENGLKAAFVDIGFEKNAFLHYWDIVPTSFDSGVEVVERESRKRERPRITQNDIPRLYPPGSDIIVQVTKGPISTKGPRVTTNIVLPGRYLVLLPNSDQSGISRKIENQEERQRLKKILRSLAIPEGMGVIMRTAGEGQQEVYFIRDLTLLLDQWTTIQENIKTQGPASCVFQEPDLIERTVRDFLTEDVERVVVDNQQAYDRMRDMISKVAVRSSFLSTSEVDKVKLYIEHAPIFDRFNITRQLENAFSRQVHLKSGGYIVIDETEALVAIDVNTGRHKGSKDQESTILKVNVEAADEICRQLRLRNMGGLIVLDFIDMKSRRDQQAVYNRVKDGVRRDKAKTHVLPISQLGLMEMTRQRHSESVRSAVYDDCPYCKGRGKVKSSVTMSVEIQRKLNEILKKRSRDENDFQLRIAVHPTVLERLRNEDEKIIIEMEKRYFGKLSFRPEPSFHAEQFKIVNVITNEELVSVGS